MKCPKCGYLRQSRDDAFAPPTECPACGIVYAKCGPGGSDTADNSQVPLSHPKKQSAVDESTLRKARERVERRLRKKTGAGAAQDDQRERMLKQARILAAEGVRKRQQEWQHRHAVETPGDLAAEDGAASGKAVNPQAINMLADQLLSPETTPGAAPNPPLDAAAEAMAIQPPPDLEDTISEAPLLVENTASMPPAAPAGIDSSRQASAGENQLIEESKVISIAARADQTNEGSAEERLESDDQPGMPTMSPEANRTCGKEKTGGLMRFFQAVAWLILVAGVGGAVLSWITLTDVQAGNQMLAPMNTSNLSMALLLGFAYLAIGVLGFAFFWVASLIGGQLAEIRRILLQDSQTV